MEAIRYQGVVEGIYTHDHPSVLYWSHFFSERFRRLEIFVRFEARASLPSVEAATATAVHWHLFSDMMPWVLSLSTAKLSSNRMRHYTIQSAFEELGMREEGEIHPDLFLKAAHLVGVTETDYARLSKDNGMVNVLNCLKTSVKRLKADAEILGFLLGLEILADENIETLFKALCHDQALTATLSDTKFFRIHRVVEAEHIRLAISNFLRFCRTIDDRAQFMKGFDRGLRFWAMFWSALADLIQSERSSYA